MQKFTRPLTREIKLAEERLALTFDENGISLRPVGSRRPPWTITWPRIVCHVTAQGTTEGAAPSAVELAAAVEALKSAAPAAGKAEKSNPVGAQQAQEPGGTAQSSGSQDVAALLERLARWLAQHRPRFLQGLQPEAGSADLDALQAGLGIPIPDELRQLLAWHNGQSDDFSGALEQSWNLMSAQEILAAKQQLDGSGAAEGPATAWQPAWLPFLEDDVGDYLCLDTSQPRAAVREVWRGKSEAPVAAPSLTAWLESFVKAVEGGAYHEDPERGTFLRKPEARG